MGGRTTDANERTPMSGRQWADADDITLTQHGGKEYGKNYILVPILEMHRGTLCIYELPSSPSLHSCCTVISLHSSCSVISLNCFSQFGISYVQFASRDCYLCIVRDYLFQIVSLFVLFFYAPPFNGAGYLYHWPRTRAALHCKDS